MLSHEVKLTGCREFCGRLSVGESNEPDDTWAARVRGENWQALHVPRAASCDGPLEGVETLGGMEAGRYGAAGRRESACARWVSHRRPLPKLATGGAP